MLRQRAAVAENAIYACAGLLGAAYAHGRLATRMRNRFDHMAKQIGQQALNAVGTTVIQDAINPETQYADLHHEPDPLRESERHRLGLLGQLAAWPCLIEVYSKAPNAEEFRACLSKRAHHRRTDLATLPAPARAESEPRMPTSRSSSWPC
jgi:hypothetical protein